MAYPNYKLIYFDTQGRAEIIRFIFAQAGVPYEDKRLTQEEWQQLKPSTPYGTVPVLEVDGKQLSGTTPIVRFLAERYGLAGSNDFENADIAGIGDVVGDLAQHAIRIFFEQDEARKCELKKEFIETHVPRYLGALQKRASGNNCYYGWIWGPKVTYADLSIYLMLEQVLISTTLVPDVLDRYPALKKLHDSVEALPNIAKWLKDRPPEAPRKL